MSGFEVGFIIGTVFAGVPAGVMGLLTYQWWKDRPRRVDTERWKTLR